LQGNIRRGKASSLAYCEITSITLFNRCLLTGPCPKNFAFENHRTTSEQVESSTMGTTSKNIFFVLLIAVVICVNFYFNIITFLIILLPKKGHTSKHGEFQAQVSKTASKRKSH
jgi:hypothetical protein